MANSALILTSIDFDTLKQEFKTFLKTQSVFKDYNYDGSNINVLLDVMSYNTYLNSFYLNMVASEMFLDSAQSIDSVVSHAKELNYTRQSNKSSVSFVNFNAETIGLSGKLNIPQGIVFTGTNSNGTFNFTTNKFNLAISANNTFAVNNLDIYEGNYFTDSFLVNTNTDQQKYLLSNFGIDTDSLSITVIENNGANTTIFNKAINLFGLTSNSNIYFLQAAQNNQYEVLFGDNILGRKPLNNSLIVATYRVSSGSDADGVSNFSISSDLGAVNNGSVSPNSIVTISASYGGANQESIDSIKYNAPRYFAAQQRAVGLDDYKSLILNNFSGDISDVITYGGETLPQKQYGRVVVCLKPRGLTIAPNFVKNKISAYLTNYIVLPNRIIITDPDYFYIGITSTVSYDSTATVKYSADIQNSVINTITNFSTTNIEKFGLNFRYSKLVAQIDASDTSIISNFTNIKLIKRIAPVLNVATTFNINYNNRPSYETGVAQLPRLTDEPTLTSSTFTFIDAFNNQYTNSMIKDDGQGKLVVFTTINNVLTILNNNIGSIDYVTGKVSINKLLVSNYVNYISVYINVNTTDIVANTNQILLININDINISLQY